MEFVGPGVASMTTDYRNGVDVMTTETTCLTSIWRTDEDTRNYLAKHHREEDYRKLDPADIAYYDGCEGYPSYGRNGRRKGCRRQGTFYTA